MYDVKLKTRLAFSYYDNAVLENYHTAILLKTLDKSDIKLLNKVQGDQVI